MVYDLSEIRNEIEARTQEIITKRQEDKIKNDTYEFIKQLISIGVDLSILNYEQKPNSGNFPYARHTVSIPRKEKDSYTQVGLTKQSLLVKVSEELKNHGIDVSFEEDDTFFTLVGNIYILDLMK